MPVQSQLIAEHDDAARRLIEQAGDDAAVSPDVEYLAWGDAAAVVATYGVIELEYGSIRRGAGIIDQAGRGTLRITGADRITFLNDLVTQELTDLQPGGQRQAFWLNRKGRIEADLTVAATETACLLILDRLVAPTVREALESYHFAEDVEIEDVSDECHHLGIHGRQATAFLADRLDDDVPPGVGEARSGTIADVPVTIGHDPVTGHPGYDVICPASAVTTVWRALLAAPGDDGGIQARPLGWFAFNMARIEAGRPLFNVDFGPTTLPHESGLLAERVSFTKGCFPGQEVVARMEHLGQPKQMLVGLRPTGDHLPASEARVFAPPKEDEGSFGAVVGAVTSSAPSPLLGSVPIAFAMVKRGHASEGTAVRVEAEGEIVDATITPLFHVREVLEGG